MFQSCLPSLTERMLSPSSGISRYWTSGKLAGVCGLHFFHMQNRNKIPYLSDSTGFWFVTEITNIETLHAVVFFFLSLQG